MHGNGRICCALREELQTPLQLADLALNFGQLRIYLQRLLGGFCLVEELANTCLGRFKISQLALHIHIFLGRINPTRLLADDAIYALTQSL